MSGVEAISANAFPEASTTDPVPGIKAILGSVPLPTPVFCAEAVAER